MREYFAHIRKVNKEANHKKVDDFRKSKLLNRIREKYDVYDQKYRFVIVDGDNAYLVYPLNETVYDISKKAKYKGYKTLKKILFLNK